MQKKLIALAVAAAAGSAFAQTNVTMYGIADVGYLNATGKQVAPTGNNKFSGIQSGLLSTSRLGFKGTEDLGNGLKALFTIETALQMDANQTGDTVTNGASTQANSGVFGMNRQSFIGLSGGFGTVVAGRLQTPVSDFYSKYAPLGGSGTLDPVLQVQEEVGAAGSTDRVDNAVAFVSPNFSGLTMKAAYSFAGELKGNAVPVTDTTTNAKRSATVLAADYDNGPLSVGGVYRVLGDSSNNNGTANNGDKQWSLGTSYNFGVAKAFATYQKASFDNGVNAAKKYKTYSVGVAVPVSAAGTVVASYAVSKDTNQVDDFGAKGYTLAYTHGFSKRTTGYAGYTVLDGRKDQAVNLGGVIAGLDKKSSGFALGLRHSF